MQINRETVPVTLVRWLAEGVPGLDDKSRAPHHPTRKTGYPLGGMRVMLTVKEMHFAPAGMDDFFAEVGESVAYASTVPAPQGPPDMERFMGICQKHGVVFAGPPPSD